jgi:hypothetical protein
MIRSALINGLTCVLFDHSVQARLGRVAVGLLLGPNGQKFTIDNGRERMYPGGVPLNRFHGIAAQGADILLVRHVICLDYNSEKFLTSSKGEQHDARQQGSHGYRWPKR